jgi:hypothetical protein
MILVLLPAAWIWVGWLIKMGMNRFLTVVFSCDWF